jgi:diguanylate cyclase (GGDEF)-like protein/PAS domain S-box-containing protein
MNTTDSRDDQPGEGARREALAQLEILDTPAEHEFDEVVELAARLFGAPISAIALLDGDRVWFKAKVGLEVSEIPREVSICAHTVEERKPLVVVDASANPRFAKLPLVSGPPYVRFYAGVPLISAEGHAYGTLCVIDSQQHEPSNDHLFALNVLANQVMARLELRRSRSRLQQLVFDGDQAQRELLHAQGQLIHRIEERTHELELANAAQHKAQQLFSILWETTADAVLIIDQDSRIQYANPGTSQMLGYRSEQLVGQSLEIIQPERLREEHRIGMQQYLRSGAKGLNWRATDAVAVRADGSEMPVEIALSDIELNGTRLFVGFFRDLTSRKQSEAALHAEQERALTTLKSISDGVITTDILGRVTFLNGIAQTLTGWSQEEAAGRPSHEVLTLIAEDHDAPRADPVQEVIRQEASMAIGPNTLLASRDGTIRSLEGAVAPILDRDHHLIGTVIAFRDVSHSRALAQQMTYQATHDPLTGLVNRFEFDRRLREAVEGSGCAGRHHAVLYLDLDQFKLINDTCGHNAGDDMLKQLAALLRLQLRDSDTLARLGGDEFGILLENCQPKAAATISESLRRAVSGFNFSWEDKAFSLGVSIGQVNVHDASLNLSEILSHADEACYVAKDKGRNRIHVYQPEDQAQAERHGEMEWIGRINKALAGNRFSLYLQPIFDLACLSAAPRQHDDDRVLPRDRAGVHAGGRMRMTGADG